MLSTEYRLRLEYICNRISKGEEVKLEDMIWADKLARANRSAGEMLRKARRHAANPDMVEGSIAKILRKYFFRDPSRHVSSFNSPDEIVDWFRQEKPGDWRQRD